MSSAVGFAAGPIGIATQAGAYLPRAYYATFTPASTNANTTDEQTVTVTGVSTGDHVSVSPPDSTTGVGIVGCFASAANTVTVCFGNFTGGSLTAPSGTYKFLATKCV